MRILDTLCDITDSLIVKLYHLKVGDARLDALRNEVGWYLEEFDRKLNDVVLRHYGEQKFIVGERVRILNRKWDVRYDDGIVVKVLESDQHPGYLITYGDREHRGVWQACDLRKL